jgi:hypothetical protein
MTDTSGGGGQGGAGYMLPGHGASEYERTMFRQERALAQVRTSIPVRIVKVYKQDGKTEAKRGEVAGAGFVDVQPIVSQVDGQGKKQDHVTIYHIPYVRNYGGDGAIISDPVKGDVGHIQIADRDTSSFEDTITQGSTQNVTPSSRRRFSPSDSHYVGGVLNKAPKQYVTFTDGGIEVTSTTGTMTVKDKSGSFVVLDGKGNVQVKPGGGLVFLGGTGSDGGYDFVSTPSGPSVNVKAKIS